MPGQGEGFGVPLRASVFGHESGEAAVALRPRLG